MITDKKNILEQLLRECGESWLLQSLGDPKEVLAALRATLARATRLAESRLGKAGPKFTAESLLAEHKRNPHKVKAFVQALSATSSAEMLLMAWRIIQGMGIAEVDMAYRANNIFTLKVVLSAPYDGQPPETYSSVDIDDAALLRHFGITKMGIKPLFDGFYPLRLKDDKNDATP